MIEIGDEVTVFKEKNEDYYHKQGEYKKGIVLAKYPNFYLLQIEGKYKECFKRSEINVKWQ